MKTKTKIKTKTKTKMKTKTKTKIKNKRKTKNEKRQTKTNLTNLISQNILNKVWAMQNDCSKYKYLFWRVFFFCKKKLFYKNENEKPVLQQLANENPEVVFVKVDVDVNQATAKKYGISAMPTFFAFKNSQKIGEMRGANVDGLKNLINQNKWNWKFDFSICWNRCSSVK